MQNTQKQATFFAALLLLFFSACGSDDEMMPDPEPMTDCAVVTAGIDANLSVNREVVCVGDTVTVLISASEGTSVTFNDGQTTTVLEFPTGDAQTFEIVPTETSVYSLERIATAECEKELTDESVTVTVNAPPAFMTNIVGEWDVTNSNGSSGGVITFNADGTGTATEAGAFSEQDFFDQEFSTDFEWVFNPNTNRLGFTFLFDGIDTVRTDDVLDNDCDSVTIRNNQTDDGDTHVLTRRE